MRMSTLRPAFSPATIRRHTGDEQGAVAVIVAILLVSLFGFVAFALDTGNTWQTRRHLITATDSASLAAAREFALGNDGCAGTDDAYVELNFPGSSVETCERGGSGSTGYVTVGATHDVEWNFARIFGLNGKTVRSSTTAAWSIPAGLTGLRPLGLCSETPALQTWLNYPTGPTGPSGTIRIFYNKELPDQCGDTAPGNWGVQDFNGGSNSNNETRSWMANGYDGMVFKNTWSPGNTGAFSNSLNSELSDLVDQTFLLPIFDDVSGNGSNAQFHIIDFVGVKLIGYRATGAEAQRYLDLQFQLLVAQGQCCDRGGSFTGVSIVHICSVDRAVFDPNAC
jgi:hypothetical protein